MRDDNIENPIFKDENFSYLDNNDENLEDLLSNLGLTS
jgi:hypothetical protein